MCFHVLELIQGKLPWLFQDRVCDGDFPNIVKRRKEEDVLDLLIGQRMQGSHLTRNEPREVGHAIEMRPGVDIALMHQTCCGFHACLECADAGNLVDDDERDEMPEDIEIVQDLFSEYLPGARIEKDKSEKHVAQVHRERITRPIASLSYFSGMFPSFPIEDP